MSQAASGVGMCLPFSPNYLYRKDTFRAEAQHSDVPVAWPQKHATQNREQHDWQPRFSTALPHALQDFAGHPMPKSCRVSSKAELNNRKAFTALERAATSSPCTTTTKFAGTTSNAFSALLRTTAHSSCSAASTKAAVSCTTCGPPTMLSAPRAAAASTRSSTLRSRKAAASFGTNVPEALATLSRTPSSSSNAVLVSSSMCGCAARPTSPKASAAPPRTSASSSNSFLASNSTCGSAAEPSAPKALTAPLHNWTSRPSCKAFVSSGIKALNALTTLCRTNPCLSSAATASSAMYGNAAGPTCPRASAAMQRTSERLSCKARASGAAYGAAAPPIALKAVAAPVR
mmetsp:Transcript_66693/g.168216  ORF Transcript_66693/g.168216 Transcript_66693/m.168216 type:complete len:345 (+) Transcript_66693:261-1295(+)